MIKLGVVSWGFIKVPALTIDCLIVVCFDSDRVFIIHMKLTPLACSAHLGPWKAWRYFRAKKTQK